MKYDQIAVNLRKPLNNDHNPIPIKIWTTIHESKFKPDLNHTHHEYIPIKIKMVQIRFSTNQPTI